MRKARPRQCPPGLRSLRRKPQEEEARRVSVAHTHAHSTVLTGLCTAPGREAGDEVGTGV